MSDRQIFDRIKVLREGTPKSISPQFIQNQLDINRANGINRTHNMILANCNKSSAY